MKYTFTIFSFVTFPDLQHFSTLSHKRQDFRKIILDIKYLFRFSLQLLSEELFILRRNEKYMIINGYLYSRKIQVILVIL
jgi:hypothetical protein